MAARTSISEGAARRMWTREAVPSRIWNLSIKTETTMTQRSFLHSLCCRGETRAALGSFLPIHVTQGAVPPWVQNRTSPPQIDGHPSGRTPSHQCLHFAPLDTPFQRSNRGVDEAMQFAS